MALLVRDPAPAPLTLSARAFAIGTAAPGAFQADTPSTPNPCGGEITGNYDIRADDERCLVEVRVRVQLVAMAEPVDEGFQSISFGCTGDRTVATADAVAARAVEWRRLIRQVWSRKHEIRALSSECPCGSYEIDIGVDWVTATESPHTIVSVHSGCERADSENFFIDMQPRVAAHEFGHWLGLLDEYTDTFWEFLGIEESCRTTTDMSSIMWGSNVPLFNDSRVYPFHYHQFAEWLARTRCCDFEVGRIDDVGLRFRSMD